MIPRIVGWSARRWAVVLVAAVLVVVAGALARASLPRDVLPDLSAPQVVLTIDWAGHAAGDVAEQASAPLSRALGAVPGVSAVRGVSMTGMAYVDAVLAPGADPAEAREAVRRAVEALRPSLPPAARLTIGPLASATGWVLEYALVDPHRRSSAVELRRLQDEVLRPALAAQPGVAEVASMGPGVEQIGVEIEAAELRARGRAVSEVLGAVAAALADGGVQTPGDLSRLALPDATSGPARLGDVARVRASEDMPLATLDYRGLQPAVGGVVIARRDVDVAGVVARAKEVLDRARPGLPAGVEIAIAYDRSSVVRRVDGTLLRALGEEVGVVVLVCAVFLLHPRSAAVTLLTLPCVLGFTFLGMWILHVPATLMSMGGVGIALGLAVDADVVALEACHRALEGGGERSRRRRLLDASGAIAPAVLTSLVITALTFLPALAFTGEAGRLLRPLAITKTLLVAGATLASLTVAPALRDRLLGGRVVAEQDNPLVRALVGAYRPFVHLALSRPGLTLTTAAVAVLSCVPLLGRLGSEFLPRIDEGDLLLMPTTLAGASDEDTAAQLFQQDRALRALPEVEAVLGKAGRADTATDPAPMSMIETVVGLRDRDAWPLVARPRWYSSWAPAPLRAALGLGWSEATRETPGELRAKLDRAAALPGWTVAWTAPIRARIDMTSTGVRTQLALRITADPWRLDALGSRLRGILEGAQGVRSAVFESVGGESRLAFEPDGAALARHRVDPELARATAEELVSGGEVGRIAVGGRVTRVRVAPDLTMAGMGPHAGSLRGAADQLRAATVRAADGAPVPLGLVGKIDVRSVPAALRTEGGEAVAYVYVDDDGAADLTTLVASADRAVTAALASGQVELAPGERLSWTGQYALLQAGERRLAWIAPVVLASMLALLVAQFRSLAEALIVLASVPFALVGSVWALWLAGFPLSAPVWVGLLAVVGLAMQTGVVMVVYVDEAFHRRLRAGQIRTRDDLVAAHAEGTVRRLRPKLMTVTAIIASLAPLCWSEGTGSEILRRVAVPMLGGVMTSALLTLEVLPVLYTMWRARQLAAARAAGIALEGWLAPARAID